METKIIKSKNDFQRLSGREMISHVQQSGEPFMTVIWTLFSLYGHIKSVYLDLRDSLAWWDCYVVT